MQQALSASHRIDVPKLLKPEQIAFFVEEGYLVVPDLMTAAELDELKADTVKIARGGYPSDRLKPLPAEMPADEVLRNILCIHQPHYISPVMLKYVQHAKICGILSQIVAAHLPAWDGSVKCMQSMLFVKPPDFQGQPWHQDEIYIPTRDRSLCGAWIALDDATVENGCLWILPGSHRSGYLYPQRSHTNTEEFDFSEESFGFDDSKKIPVVVKAGAVVFFNGYLLHSSRKNRSQIYRRVLVNHYMNAWSLLPWHYEEGLSIAKQDMRRIVPVAGCDPYAWKPAPTGKLDVFLRTCKANAALVTPDADINKQPKSGPRGVGPR
ncbi:MAG: phytanoyl-CoA dioxygenase family protein [Lentisphaerae bacterium]|nr:phytanoyl-CoA dioxygenase family protein [Lentisphaerota bacterium]